MAENNRIRNVAIVGASGRLGKHFAEELLKTGNHTVTALTRSSGTSALPTGIKVAKVDYEDENDESLVSALRGQQFLVITLSVHAPPSTQSKIIAAAAKAGVPYIMPNVYGGDITNESLRKEDLYSAGAWKSCLEIEQLGPAYVAMCCGFWYEWSLALGEECFGFDIKNRRATFYDDGETKINSSTWLQCGRALAGLLSLPEKAAEPGVAAVAEWSNKLLYVSSFRLSQRDMLDSIHRVTGSTDSDWEIKREPTKQRYQDGLDEIQKGLRNGFAKALYARGFFPDGSADFETTRGLTNEVLGLPTDDLDEATKRAVEMVESNWNPFG
ncbi:MAG: hypothetical protein HETSPECPRED_007931 [Heterodermia speciosa]|uniref:NmrA-like domain-containing protein n=1 Tax=Heterodermia speciosa TaxID=116794 RepID=A0A8H3I956_9LECA|nr:MAG: hypothetical protein HETSPECPRED_007931 [Heterodermia speciosa]